MPVFKYEAIDNKGKIYKGNCDALSEQHARKQLTQNNDWTILELHDTTVMVEDKPSNWWSTKAFNVNSLGILTRQLAGLIDAGLPLERSLSVLTEQNTYNEVQNNILLYVKAEINAGSTFAKALEHHPREFNESYRAVVNAAEQSGALATVLESLADDMEAQNTLRSKLIAASLYPGLVVLFACIMVMF